MKKDHIQQLKIPASAKKRPKSTVTMIYGGIVLLLAIAVWFAWPREGDDQRILDTTYPGNIATTGAVSTSSSNVHSPEFTSARTGEFPSVKASGHSLLTVSGYIVNRERIELSPRFMGVVRDIRVKKGDSVTKDQVVAVLDDVEYLAQLKQAKGALEVAQVQVKQAQLDVDRARRLVAERVEMKATLEDAELRLAAGQADVKRLEGQVELVQTYLDWTIIRSPINGVVLEKLVDPNELVTPQSFGGTRGPSTALISLGDPEDLQVEIELNESDLSKIYLNQACRISPEAYLDRMYQGYVVEIAPEANRQKGTLQIKVQIENPDKYLTPELSAKVDFMPGNTE